MPRGTKVLMDRMDAVDAVGEWIDEHPVLAFSSVLQAAQILASNSDPQLAALGTDAIARLERLGIELQ